MFNAKCEMQNAKWDEKRLFILFMLRFNAQWNEKRLIIPSCRVLRDRFVQRTV